MKTLSIFLILFGILAIEMFGQKKGQSPLPAKANVADTERAEAEDLRLLTELQSAKNRVFECHERYFKSALPDKIQTHSACVELATNRLNELFFQLSKRPVAMGMMLSNELSRNYLYSYNRSTPMDPDSDSRIELQRIIVIQNQRIIDLLEQLLKKKP